MNEAESFHESELRNDPLLRHEAGEGWRTQGVDGALLDLIVKRELVVDALVEREEENRERLHGVLQEIEDYRHEHRLPDPLDLPPMK